MITDLPNLLVGLLAERELSIRAAAKLIGMDHAYLLRVTKGALALPSKHLEKTADILQLTGRQRQEFVLAAHIQRSPEVVRDYIRLLEQRKLGR